MSARALLVPPIEAYALWAAAYDESPNPLLSLEERIVEGALPPLDGRNALDVACGTGRWLERLVRRGAGSVIGLDFSEEMLRVARRKAGLDGRLIGADGMAMPVRSASVDFAICSFALGYMEDLPSFVNEVSRVVGGRGQFVLTDFHPSAHDRGWKRRFRHKGTLVEISSVRRPIGDICRAFSEARLEPTLVVEPPFGEPERCIFERCGKVNLFDEWHGEPAIYVCVFERT